MPPPGLFLEWNGRRLRAFRLKPGHVRRLFYETERIESKNPVNVCKAHPGILFLAAGLWLAGLCMLLGSYILEKSSYRCPHCGRKLDMKYPLPKGSCCPFCRGGLRK